MKRLSILFLAYISLITSCEKEPVEFGGKISVRGLTFNSVEISASAFLTGASGSIERGIKLSESPKDESHYYSYSETTINAGNGNGSIVETIENLKLNTTYYCHPYAYSSGRIYRGEEISFISNLLYTGDIDVGQIGPGGGSVFYIDGQGGGMEAVYYDSWSGAWGCDMIDILGTLTDFGSGLNNTAAINTNCTDSNAAANTVFNLTFNGFSNWYLPSKDELDSIYTNAFLPGHLSVPTQTYFSSSQVDQEEVWAIDFTDGTSLAFDKVLTPGPRIIMVRNF